jgi:hypothetical protein
VLQTGFACHPFFPLGFVKCVFVKSSSADTGNTFLYMLVSFAGFCNEIIDRACNEIIDRACNEIIVGVFNELAWGCVIGVLRLLQMRLLRLRYRSWSCMLYWKEQVGINRVAGLRFNNVTRYVGIMLAHCLFKYCSWFI